MTPRAGTSTIAGAVPDLFDLEPDLADLLRDVDTGDLTSPPTPDPESPTAEPDEPDEPDEPATSRRRSKLALSDLVAPPPLALRALPVGGLPDLTTLPPPLPPPAVEPATSEPGPAESAPVEPARVELAPACPPHRLVTGSVPPRDVAIDLPRPPCPPTAWRFVPLPAAEPDPEPDPEPPPPPEEISRPEITAPPRSAVMGAALQHLLASPRGRRIAAAGALLAALIGAALTVVAGRSASDSIDRPRAAISSVVDSTTARIATARLPLVDVYAHPSAGTVVETLEHPMASGGPLTLLVEGESDEWLRVRLPTAPAGRSGWVRSAAFDLTSHPVRLQIDLDRHLLTIFEGGRGVTRLPVALGRQDTPEPGTTFIVDRLVPSDPTSGYGSEALLLAGYGNGAEHLFRGTGLVAIHGVVDPTTTGQTVSRGSVGLHRSDLERVSDLVVAGTPVEIIGGQ